jgi:hypothetical protein
MIRRSRFVHCVPTCTSPVAVHGWSATRARDEVCGLGQGTTEVDVWRVCVDLEELVVGQHTVVVRASSCYSHY